MRLTFAVLVAILCCLVPQAAEAAVGIAIRTDSTCAIMEAENNKLYCWGSNSQCQTGSSCSNTTIYPTPKSGLTSNVTQVTKYDWGTCVIHSGAVKCWGDNTFGQRGKDPSIYGDSATPATIPNLTTQVLSVVGGYEHICATTVASDVRCWGVNTYGQLGDGTFNNIRWIPVVAIATGAAQVAVGGTTTCARMNDGTVKCWGLHHGNASPAGEVLTPTTVSGLTGVTDIAAGDSHFCVVTGGQIKCWGSNVYGQFGNNTTTSSKTPVTTLGNLSSNALRVYAGLSYTCGLKDDSGYIPNPSPSRMLCWGRNNRGQLGDGTSTDRLLPNYVQLGPTVMPFLGNENTCSLLLPTGGINGKYSCWGDNSHKQLGAKQDGTWYENPRELPISFYFWGGPYVYTP